MVDISIFIVVIRPVTGQKKHAEMIKGDTARCDRDDDIIDINDGTWTVPGIAVYTSPSPSAPWGSR